jgi:transcriptional regulator with XRE-family HTH domain
MHVSAINQVRRKLGENIRVFRKDAGLSKERLAEKADLHPVYIGQVERGTKAISVEAVWKIARALKIPVAQLFHGIK